jgi:hypothetical protein
MELIMGFEECDNVQVIAYTGMKLHGLTPPQHNNTDTENGTST